MKLTISNEFDYTPEWNNNQEADEPIVVHCRYLTAGERDKVIYPVITQRDGEMETRIEADRRGIIEKCVLSIDNLEVNGRAIKTSKELVEQRGVGELYQEIAMELISRNMSPDLKN